MTTIIYPRRSSEAGDDYSLDTQAEACLRYASANGLVGKVEVLPENFTGTKHLRDREVGAEIWPRIQTGEVTHLVVYAIDRLSRAKLSHALTMIDEILAAGTHLHSVDVGEVTSTEDIGLIVRSWQAAEERKKIVDRLMRGKIGKANAGRWVGIGRAPYGFRRLGHRDEARLEIDPDESRVVAWLVDWYLGLNDPPLAINAIRDKLFRNGIKSPAGNAIWPRKSIWAVLDNPAMCGVFKFGSRFVNLPELSIVTPEIWQAVQDRLQQNKRESRRNGRYTYLLRGRVRCHCGRLMHPTTSTVKGQQYAYYVCSQGSFHPHERTCEVARLATQRLDERVWMWTLAHISDETLAEGIKKLEEYERARPERVTDRLAEIETETARLSARINALMSEFGGSDNRIVIEARKSQIEDAAQQMLELETERAKLLASASAAEGRAKTRASLPGKIGKMRAKLERATMDQQIQIMELIELRVVVVSGATRAWAPARVKITSEIAPPEEVDL